MIQETNNFFCKAINKENWTCTIAGNGNTLNVQGILLECQFKYKNSYAFFLTGDCPFEESLFIYYTDSNLNKLECLEISQIYTGGILEIVKIQNNQIVFDFMGTDKTWILTLNEYPTFKWFRRPSYAISRKIFCVKEYMDCALVDN